MSLGHILTALGATGLTPLEKLVLIVLGNAADPDKGWSKLSQEQVADTVGASVAEVGHALHTLEQKGLIFIDYGRHAPDFDRVAVTFGKRPE